MKFPITPAELNRIEHKQPAQVASYEAIKAKIDRGINRQSEGRKEVAEGLKEMIESKAYLKKYKTIAAFAEHEYGRSARWISIQLEELIPHNTEHEPQSEDPPISSNRAEDNEQKALSQVEEAREVSPKPEKPKEQEPVKDMSHHPIPPKLLKTWERRQEVQDLMSLASQLKCAMERFYNTSDPLFRGGVLNTQIHIPNLQAIYYQLNQCKPAVLCPECNGDFEDDMGRKCTTCRNTGFISETDWLIRLKSNASQNGSARISV